MLRMDKLWSALVLVAATMVVVTNPQKVPPGVNPNAYQQPPPPQQQYQPPPPPPPQQVQYQQQPIQSAIPQEQIQQQYQPPPPQHQPPPPPQPSAHVGHDHHGQPQLLNAANLAEEKDHLQEHLSANIDTSKMSEQELQFHYFKMHDADNNNQLDGCELIKSLIHWHENESGEKHSSGEQKESETHYISKNDNELETSVDNLLNSLDKNNDGLIDWIEFLAETENDQNN